MTRPSAQRLQHWDKKYLWHPFTQQFLWEKEPTLIIESGDGVYLKDIRGRKYLDGVSSLWVNLLGHRHPALSQAIRQQLSKIAHSTFLGLSHQPAIELGRELVRIAPRGLNRVFYSDNGATAVEVALKMAFQYWIEKEKRVRPEFLAIKGSYHGDTLGSVSVGGIGSFHSKFKPLLFKTNFAMAPKCYGCPFNRKKVSDRFRVGEKMTRIPKPGDFRSETGCKWECLGDAEKILKKKSQKISAVIIEPVIQGAGGMIVIPSGYVAGLQRLANKYSVLFIADEVATGFGRTGTLFACEQEKVRPDFLCLAKALTGGYSPLAVTLTTDRVYKAFWGPLKEGRTFFHGHSYTAHPLGAAAALANLRVIKRSKLVEKTRQKAHIMKDELMKFSRLPTVGSVRQAGLMAGVELVRTKKTGQEICRKLLSHGIWIRPLGQVLVMMPPPVISDFDLRRLVEPLEMFSLMKVNREIIVWVFLGLAFAAVTALLFIYKLQFLPIFFCYLLIAVGGSLSISLYRQRLKEQFSKIEDRRSDINKTRSILEKEIYFYEERKASLTRRSNQRRQLVTAARALGACLDSSDLQTKLIETARVLFPGKRVEISIGQNNDAVDMYVIQKSQPIMVPTKTFSGVPLVAVPIKIQGAVAGVLRVGGDPGPVFSQDDFRLLDILGSLASLSLENSSLFKQIQDSALRDNLTGLWTHRAFQEQLEAALLEAARYRQSLSIVLSDVDHFKSVNDTYGHQAGDSVLQGFSHVLVRHVRDVDVVARYGGEEFILLLLQTSHAEANQVAEAVRMDLEAQRFEAGSSVIGITGSFGVATFPQDATSAQQLIRIADQRLYAAKKAGRNQVMGRAA